MLAGRAINYASCGTLLQVGPLFSNWMDRRPGMRLRTGALPRIRIATDVVCNDLIDGTLMNDHSL